MLEEPAEKLLDVEVGSAWAGTAHFTVGEGDRAICEADKTLVGDSDLEDIGGEVGEGGAAMVIRLTVDVPGAGPDLGGDVLQRIFPSKKPWNFQYYPIFQLVART